jgi:uncharacterized OsmC-like protein
LIETRSEEVLGMTTQEEQATEYGIVNGVDVDQLLGHIEAINGDPSLAEFQFRLNNTWVSGGHNRSTITDFAGVGEESIPHERPHEVDQAEPPVLLGGDEGPNPVQNLLHALAGCVTTGVVYQAAARGLKIDELTSTIEGDLDLRGFLGLSEDVRPGFRNIRLTLRIKSPEPRERIEELLQYAQKLSPVLDSVANETAVAVELATA